jgi:hypothetical protein
MRRRELLMVAAVLTIAVVSAGANKPGVSKTSPRDKERTSEVDTETDAKVNPTEGLPVETSSLISHDKVLAAAYFSTLRILSTANGCSLFFGGPAASASVFKQMFGKVNKGVFATPVGIQMSGQTTNISNAIFGMEYRLFDKVTINSHGPFYRERFSRSGQRFPRTATFEANTNEVRVLMLLHELGHVMKGGDGHWLLPDDGKDEGISRLNSQKIRDVCGEQIKALQKYETGR